MLTNKEILEDLKKVVVEAGSHILQFYKKDIEVKYKIHDKQEAPVTKADLESERVILAGLEKYNYGILSEETSVDNNRSKKERVWVIDPLDGTMDFIEMTGEFSVMVGLVERGESILGAVYQPTKNKLYYATKGEGAFLEENGQVRKLLVSDHQEFSEMKLMVSRHHLKETEVRLEKELNLAGMVPHGSAGLKIGLVAEQIGEVYINSSSKTGEWDICASDIIIREAGGKITDMDGEAIIYNKKNPLNLSGFVVTNGNKHNELIEVINRISCSLKGD